MRQAYDYWQDQPDLYPSFFFYPSTFYKYSSLSILYVDLSYVSTTYPLYLHIHTPTHLLPTLVLKIYVRQHLRYQDLLSNLFANFYFLYITFQIFRFTHLSHIPFFKHLILIFNSFLLHYSILHLSLYHHTYHLQIYILIHPHLLSILHHYKLSLSLPQISNFTNLLNFTFFLNLHNSSFTYNFLFLPNSSHPLPSQRSKPDHTPPENSQSAI